MHHVPPLFSQRKYTEKEIEAMGKIVYQTLRENVADAIRMKILSGELEPGARIVEQEIAEELGVSRGPVREALRQLEEEGLVEYARNVGCSVKKITLEDIYEIYLLRATYEIVAVKLLKGNFSDEALAEMARILDRMKTLEVKDFHDAISYDNQMHGAIIRETGLPRLTKTWTALNYGNIISYYAGNKDLAAAVARQYPIHKNLYDVCRTRDCAKICRAILDHYMLTIRRKLAEQDMKRENLRFSVEIMEDLLP